MISGKAVLYLVAVAIAMLLMISASSRRRASLIESLRQYLRRAPTKPIEDLSPNPTNDPKPGNDSN
ncbi:MAG: hypothetical protein AAF958_09105 [Planctomycetota bacterium]